MLVFHDVLNEKITKSPPMNPAHFREILGLEGLVPGENDNGDLLLNVHLGITKVEWALISSLVQFSTLVPNELPVLFIPNQTIEPYTFIHSLKGLRLVRKLLKYKADTINYARVERFFDAVLFQQFHPETSSTWNIIFGYINALKYGAPIVSPLQGIYEKYHWEVNEVVNCILRPIEDDQTPTLLQVESVKTLRLIYQLDKVFQESDDIIPQILDMKLAFEVPIVSWERRDKSYIDSMIEYNSQLYKRQWIYGKSANPFNYMLLFLLRLNLPDPSESVLRRVVSSLLNEADKSGADKSEVNVPSLPETFSNLLENVGLGKVMMATMGEMTFRDIDNMVRDFLEEYFSFKHHNRPFTEGQFFQVVLDDALRI